MDADPKEGFVRVARESDVRCRIGYRAGDKAGADDGDALGPVGRALGTVSYGENQDEVFLGMSVSRIQNASEATVRKIDSEIRRLVEEGYNPATKILTEKRADLEALAKGLLEYETLTSDEIIDLLEGKKPNRESVLEPTAPRTSAVPPAGKPRPRPRPKTVYLEPIALLKRIGKRPGFRRKWLNRAKPPRDHASRSDVRYAAIV
jgi:hypothetical protein